MSTEDTASTDEPGRDRDVVVVGGGPAGCSAAVFTARDGLDTVVFDRGPAALPRCAYLENYPGFPGGIGVDTFRSLLSDHVTAAGGTVVEDTVDRVRRAPDGGFVVETQDDRTVHTSAVVAAAWYDGSYLRPLADGEMFTEREHHGETEQRFDPDYPDRDGRTPIEGLYVAAPAGDRNDQAVISAGQGAHVARTLLADRRREQGYPDSVAERYDWMRPEAEFTGEWSDRDRWREWFHDEIPDGPELPEERLTDLREQYIDEAFETRLSDEEIERRRNRGIDRLVDHLDTERVLRAIGDERLRAYLDETGVTG
nr:FAD-binding protein [Halomicroarcula sp. DFY41]